MAASELDVDVIQVFIALFLQLIIAHGGESKVVFLKEAVDG